MYTDIVFNATVWRLTQLNAPNSSLLHLLSISRLAFAYVPINTMVIYKHQFLSVYFYFIVRYVVLLKPNHQNKDAHTHIKNYYNYLKHKILETYIITKSVKRC